MLSNSAFLIYPNILENDSQASQVASVGNKYVTEHFSAESIVSKYESLYKEIINDKG